MDFCAPPKSDLLCRDLARNGAARPATELIMMV